MRKKTKKNGNTLKFIIGILAGGAIGFAAGFLSIHKMAGLFPEASDGQRIIGLGLLILAVALATVLQLLIHESGHLLFGLLTGYGFVSFRIFNITFVKTDSGIKRRKFSIPGTLGQCLMIPPKPVDGRFPYRLYNLGGSFMNFLSALIILAPYLLFRDSPFMMLFLGFLLLFGVVFGLTNLIPLNLGGIANDGYNALTLGKRPAARHAFWMTLTVNARVSAGIRYRDMPEEWFAPLDEKELNDPLAATMGVLRYNYLLDRMDLKEARALAEHLLNTVTHMQEIHQNELRCELLFYEIIFECRKEEIERLYTPRLKRYIQATSVFLSRQRLLYAYAKWVTHDEAAMKKARDRFERTCFTWPNAGEVEGERALFTLADHF